MNKSCIILIFTVLILFVSGCEKTIIKYSCADGSIADTVDKCTTKSVCAETKCPSLDCAVCPVKTETKTVTQTLTEKVYICPDGITEVSKKDDCTAKFLSDTDYSLGDELTAGDFKWKFIKYTTDTEIGDYYGNTFMGVKADGEFLIIDVEVENVGTTAQYLMSSFVKLVDDQGREFSSDPMAAVYLKPAGSAFSFDTVNPGIVKKGKLVFDVPSGLKIAKIQVSSNLAQDSFYNVKLIT